ncbi:MAG: hypothetical protein ACYDH3_11730, partial [Candidatus Aminicenantales bacterium]
KIIAELPGSLDGMFTALRDERLDMNPGDRAWLLAAEKTGIPPAELLEKTGILAWMKGELSGSLRQVGQALRGETRIQTISIDMKPLKAALRHPEMTHFLDRLLENLPPCNEQGLNTWQERLANPMSGGDLPACRPDAAGARDILFARLDREVNKINDSVQVFENIHPFPFERFGVSRAVTTLSYLLFIIPALFIFLGAILANSTAAGRLRWSGISILAGSVPVMLMTFFLKKITSWAVGGGFWHWSGTSPWEAALVDKFSWIPDRLFAALFTPVFNTAAVVAVVGVVLIALSATSRSTAPAAKS